jgi:acylphosphatase
MSTIRNHAIVCGRVQGVGYRYFAERSAHELGLAGWVANRADGSVELEVQGAPEKVDLFFLELKKGPPHSSVTDIRISVLMPIPDAAEFAIVG